MIIAPFGLTQEACEAYLNSMGLNYDQVQPFAANYVQVGQELNIAMINTVYIGWLSVYSGTTAATAVRLKIWNDQERQFQSIDVNPSSPNNPNRYFENFFVVCSGITAIQEVTFVSFVGFKALVQ